MSDDIEQNKVFSQSIQAISRNYFNVSLEKEALEVVEKVLNGIIKNVIESSRQQSNLTAERRITENNIYQYLKNVLPERFLEGANNFAQREVRKYISRAFKYEYKRPYDVVEDVIVPVIIDFKKDVKRILQDYNVSAGRGFLPLINGYLNDICYALADKSSQNAKNNNGVLTENDVFYAFDAVLPRELKQRAIASVYRLQKDFPSSSRQITEVPENQMANNQNESVVFAEPVDESSEQFSSLDIAHQITSDAIENGDVAEDKDAEEGEAATDVAAQEDQAIEEEQNEEEETDQEEEQESENSTLLSRIWQWFSPAERNQVAGNRKAENETTYFLSFTLSLSMKSEETLEKRPKE